MTSVASRAPDWTATALLPSGSFESIGSTSFLGAWLVLLWYPLDFVSDNAAEVMAFSDRQCELNAMNTQLVVISCDSPFSHLAWTKLPRTAGGLGSLSVPLLSDFNKTISTAFGVLVGNAELPAHATCIISPDGIVRQLSLNDENVGRSVDEVVRLVKAFQYTDVHGEVCPAGWSPGASTIVPTVDGSKEYFSSEFQEGSAFFRESSNSLRGSIDVADPGPVTRIAYHNLPLAPRSSSSSLSSPSPSSSSSLSLSSGFGAALANYHRLLKSHPLTTKAATSCVVSLVGELIGSYIKGRAARCKGDKAHPFVNWQRLCVFGVYGAAITAPVFHWWYGALEKIVAALKLPPRLSNVVKIALDRALITPPFLFFTIAYLRYFQTFSAQDTMTSVRNVYAAALYTNWRVWTPAQAVNFFCVPLEYRVLFGNVVALWWNVYLSMSAS